GCAPSARLAWDRWPVPSRLLMVEMSGAERSRRASPCPLPDIALSLAADIDPHADRKRQHGMDRMVEDACGRPCAPRSITLWCPRAPEAVDRGDARPRLPCAVGPAGPRGAARCPRAGPRVAPRRARIPRQSGRLRRRHAEDDGDQGAALVRV